MPKILKEFLKTRIILKSNVDKENYQKIESEQKSLKLFMNVMYGYTSAGWTGKMPCNDIGEAIV